VRPSKIYQDDLSISQGGSLDLTLTQDSNDGVPGDDPPSSPSFGCDGSTADLESTSGFVAVNAPINSSISTGAAAGASHRIGRSRRGSNRRAVAPIKSSSAAMTRRAGDRPLLPERHPGLSWQQG
jgi:hypothetical protein